MKRIAIGALAVLLVCLGGWTVREQAAGIATDGRVAAMDPRLRGDDEMGDASTAPGSNRRTPPVSQDRIKIGDRLYGTRTQAEADWLNRNLFPPSNVIGSYRYADISEADFATMTPRSLAVAETAAIVRPDLAPRAKQHLQAGAESGSVYALEALARVYGAPRKERNPMLSEAYYAAAEMRGDWAVVAGMRTPLHGDEKVLAGFMAHKILIDIDAARARRGLAPLRREVRPGLPELLQAIQAGRQPY